MRFLVAALFAAGCVTPTSEPALFELPSQLPTPLDVLVVVDDKSLAQTAAIPDPANLGGVLEAIYNGAPDLRIAFTTSTTGTFRTSVTVPTGVIEHRRRMEDGALATNYDGPLANAIQSVMGFTAATGPNTPLAAAVAAVSDNSFLRANAALGVLLVSGTDDASPDAPGVYATALRAHATKTMVSAVTAPPAARIAEFLTGLTYRYAQSIDQYNMEAISSLAQTFEPREASSCFPIAAASANECELATAFEMTSTPLPVCSVDAWSASEPCFSFVADASCPSGWTVLFGGAYRMYHPAIIGRCHQGS